ncbi:FAD-binding oxidoreductase [Chromohalobacter canadensis]|uniref:NAD(P)/FAD-dependent oxidoreductase n=1 Tax=Chromohalobacter canadensis TaxID=141389 RepID=UPI0021C1577C|nr:FAD-binding oxidoreductase [Chromohalobacter canadensis]MCT8467241.1 FAD-binding oxidoreductase [Chromohalobacter canadensis]MCT8471011.1 FAD-binding oxidoreductase [Chromohalobacter canadensis]MCT8497738.1 FAD-binding oxidoreductase [Chromohalobacter canadensis]
MTQQRCASYYTASIAQESDYPRLEGEHRVDVAIVGGGFTGVATAVELAERGYRVAIVEANRIGWGASGRNGGQVTGSLSGQDAMTRQMRHTLGDDAENFVWNLRWRGHRIIRERVAKYAIACDLKHGHLQAAYKPSHIKALRQDFEESRRHAIGEHIHWLDAEAVRGVIGTELYHGAIRNDYNMHLHPLNLCLGEARAAASLGALIFENSPVVDIEHGNTPVVVGEHGRVTADSVILAGNAYHRLERKQLKGKLFPASLGIVTTAPLSPEQVQAIDPEDLAVYDTRFVLDYYRLTADKRLLFGGGANYSGRDSDDIASELRPRLEHTFPQLKGIAIDFQWQGMAGIVINRIPQLGKLSDHVYYAQGYSGHGIATSHIVGEIMANAVSGTLEEFDAFAEVRHIRIPLDDRLGNALLAAGMWYYQLLEKLK